MAEQNLPSIRLLGKLEEIAAVAHHLDYFTNTALSVHYRSSKAQTNLRGLVYEAVKNVLRAHHILFAVPLGLHNEHPYWGRLPSIDIRKAVSFVERTTAAAGDQTDAHQDQEFDTLLEREHNTSFKHGYGELPVWRLIIVQESGVQNEFTACFIAHHSMSDGNGLQVFHNSFQAALEEMEASLSGISEEFVAFSNADDAITPSLEQVHPFPLPNEPPEADTSGVKDWTGSPVALPCKTRYSSLSLTPQHYRAFAIECKKNKSTPTAALPSLIARSLFESLPAEEGSLLLNLPVSLRNDLPTDVVQGVMGNFIDAFKVKLLRAELDSQGSQGSADAESGHWNIWNHAKTISQATRKYFANTSPTGQPYTNIAFFKLIPSLTAALQGIVGNPRGESFEVSNLGVFSQVKNTQVWKAGKVTLSRCAYAAGAPLVVCVLTSDDNLGLGFTWQEGAIGEDIVRNVISGVERYFEALLSRHGVPGSSV